LFVQIKECATGNKIQSQTRTNKTYSAKQQQNQTFFQRFLISGNRQLKVFDDFAIKVKDQI
jgi:hypothetical protein